MDTNVNQTPATVKLKLTERLNATPATQIVSLPEVADRFKDLYSKIHPGSQSEVFYEAEKFHFAKLIQEKPDLQECSKLSLYGCFLDVAVSGLSFDPSFKHIYLVSQSFKVGDKWEKRAVIWTSGQGELLLRMKQGHVRYVDNPVLVYEGDDFVFGTDGTGSFVRHNVDLAKRGKDIVAAYLKIIRNDGSVDYKIMTRQEVERLRSFSKQPNSLAWTTGFPGMFESKLIKHAFKNYPKLRVGDNTRLDPEAEEEEFIPIQGASVVPAKIDYGTDDESFAAPDPKPAAPTVNVQPMDDDAF